MRRRYEITLGWALHHPRLMLLLMVITVVTNGFLFMKVPKGFFPEQDTGRIMGIIQAEQDISFQSMRDKLAKVLTIIKSDPEVVFAAGFTGGGGGGGTAANTARTFISLKPFDERKSSIGEVIARLRKKLMHLPGALTILQPVQDLRIGGRLTGAQYQYTLQGDNLEDLVAWSPRILQRLRTLSTLVDVNSDQQNKGREATLVIDRTTASRLGITPQMIDDALYDAFGQRQVAITYTLLNQYHVVMEVAPEYWQHPDTLRDIYVRGTTGAMVPLSAFTRFERTATSLAVNHQSQFPSVTLSFNLLPGKSLGEAVKEVESATRSNGDAFEHSGQFCRHGPGLPGLPGQPALAHPGGAGGGLYRPGHPLRKLRPPHHHPFHLTVGRGRGPSGPFDLPLRADRHCFYRHYSFDRDRQKKRDHDGGLRFGGRTPGREKPGGGHLPGLPAAVQTDHDDHHGRPVRGPSPGPGPGSGLRAAPSFGDRHRRRTDLQPDAHPLYDAGHVPVSRPLQTPDEEVEAKTSS